MEPAAGYRLRDAHESALPVRLTWQRGNSAELRSAVLRQKHKRVSSAWLRNLDSAGGQRKQEFCVASALRAASQMIAVYPMEPHIRARRSAHGSRDWHHLRGCRAYLVLQK